MITNHTAINPGMQNPNIPMGGVMSQYHENQPGQNQFTGTGAMQSSYMQPGGPQFQQQQQFVNHQPGAGQIGQPPQQHQVNQSQPNQHPSNPQLGAAVPGQVPGSQNTDMSTAKATDVLGRLKILSERHLKESLHKLISTCIAAVNNQGGRDNGATDVSTSSSSASSSGDKDASAEYSNIAFGQAVEECMGVLDQIELNLQLSIDWSNQMKLMDKFCSPQLSQHASHDQFRNVTTEDVLAGYEVHREYSEKMKGTIDSFLKQLSTNPDDQQICGSNVNDSQHLKNVNSFACSALL